MQSSKITSSRRKLDAWAEIRQMDRRALELMAAGLGLEEAYRQAADEQWPDKPCARPGEALLFS